MEVYISIIKCNFFFKFSKDTDPEEEKKSIDDNIENDNKLYREPKCARCRIHGVITESKGHKYKCAFRKCVCTKCRNVAERQRVTAKRVAHLREKRKQNGSPSRSNSSDSSRSDSTYSDRCMQVLMDTESVEDVIDYLPKQKKTQHYHQQQNQQQQMQKQQRKCIQTKIIVHTNDYTSYETPAKKQCANTTKEQSKALKFSISNIMKENEPFPLSIDETHNYMLAYDIAWLQYKFTELSRADVMAYLNASKGSLPLALDYILTSKNIL